MEINVNDYVRIDGYISKIEHLRTSSSGKTYAQWKQPNGLLASGNINIIEKSSPNIGKLLKVGDFIDGMPIVEIEDTTIHTLGGWFIDVDDVEDLVTSIVTKEMFEQMEYKIN